MSVSTANLPLAASFIDLLGHQDTGGGTRSLRRVSTSLLLTQIAAVAGSTPAQVFSTLAQANESLNYGAYTMAWVTDDPVVANRGVYQKSGSSGLGFWAKLAELPYSFLFATSVGGTGNDITATLEYQYSPVTTLIIAIAANTNSANARINFNGAGWLSILTASGNEIPAGGIVPGLPLIGIISNSEFRLMSDYASASNLAATEAFRDEAETFRDEAEDFAADAAASAASAVAVSNAYPRVNRSAMKALNTTTFKTAYLTESGVEAIYDWDADWPKELCSAETAEVRYISPNLAANGAWVRRVDLDPNDYAAFSRLKRKIESGQNSVIVVLGDSTGNASNEFIYLFGAWLGAKYPTMDIQYYLWNTGTENYDSVVTISNGSGSNTCKIYNASVPGYNLIGWLGSRLTNALINVSNVDCIFMNAGLNVSGLNDQDQQRKSFNDAVQTVAMYKPGVSIAMHLEQPLTDSTLMNKVTAAQRQVAKMTPGLSLIDTHSILIDAAKPVALYADNTHLTGSGLVLPLRTLQRAYVAAPYEEPKVDLPSWVDTADKVSLLKNGDFPSGATTDWTFGGSGSNSVDMVTKYGAEAQSVKLVSTNAYYIQQALDSDQLARVKGRTLGLMARVWTGSSNPAYSGVLYGTTSVGGATVKEGFRFNAGDGNSGWRLITIENFHVPWNATSVSVRVYASGNATAATMYLSRVWAFEMGPFGPLHLLPA